MLQGYITTKEEFLFPDTPLGELPISISTCCALNGSWSVQVLLQACETVSFSTQGPFACEVSAMVAMPVTFNTGNGIDQGGAMVLQAETKPDYSIRKAPFTVYDCLVPVNNGKIEPHDNVSAIYLNFTPKQNINTNNQSQILQFSCNEQTYTCTVNVKVYNVTIPPVTYPITNWFSLDAISRQHNLPTDSTEFLEMVYKYALAMRRTHQTIFFINLENELCVKSTNPYTFDFEYLTPIIEIFFKAGMTTMEIGTLLGRGVLPCGTPNMKTNKFTCRMAENVYFETNEGYALISTYLKTLSTYLENHGWKDKVLFHIHDEPDVHIENEQTIEDRRRQYYLAASMVRKYLPNVKIIEAVKTTAFYGGIDILVPITDGYEANKAEFDRFTQLGESVWTYVCCGPQGHYLNRFMDFAVLKGRLLFWGCSKYELGGYLHWGFNQFPIGMNPFEETSCPNPTGLGTNFPSGDAFIVLPGDNGPLLTMRLEASRRGAEDIMLLNLLRSKDISAYNSIMDSVFTSFCQYNHDSTHFAKAYENILETLERYST